MNPEIKKSLRHNTIVNLLDGAFFGLALGFASFVTVLPLYVSAMTSSAILIGLIPAIHNAGWQLPQLFTARRVARQSRIKPMMLAASIHERLPYLGLALLAWSLPTMRNQTALWITFGLLIWQGLGGGITANPWQSMIAKIIPSDRLGTFLGAQAAAANLLASVGAIIAGFILDRYDSPNDFAFNFLLAFLAMMLSWIFLAQTRESETSPSVQSPALSDFWSHLGTILRRDRRFRWFLVVRMVSQIAIMGSAFYTVFAVGQRQVGELQIGWMTSALLATQIIANPLMGWAGDRWGRSLLMEIGLGAAILSSLIAWKANSAALFYPVFILYGIAHVAVWTVGMAMILEFSQGSDRPAYIGMANTLVAPAIILAPFLGGWLADLAGYPAAFLASAAGGMAALLIFHRFVRSPSIPPLPERERGWG